MNSASLSVVMVSSRSSTATMPTIALIQCVFRSNLRHDIPERGQVFFGTVMLLKQLGD